MASEKEDIPLLARKCFSRAQEAETDLRRAMTLRWKMYASGGAEGLAWDPAEKARREGKRPYLEINECKPPCDAIETNIRINPPGPITHPVDSGSDETADVISGMIRQIEYASNSQTIYSQAGRDSTASGYGVIEWATRYTSPTSFDQELYLVPNEDASVWWFDPLARRPNREDAMWAIKGPKILSQEAYMEAYGKKHKVLDGGFLSTVQTYAGRFQDMLGWSGNYQSMNLWTTNGKGPFWVAEFWRVTVTLKTLRLYTDNIARYDDEPVPATARRKTDADGDDSDYVRKVPIRKVMKYVVDACEVLEQVEWIGDHIPCIAVLGPEIWIDGKLYRLSLIHGMIDSQRAFNYVATSMTEIAGKVPKAPWTGTKGQFIDEKWSTASVDDWAYLEVTPVEMVSELSNASTFAPMPTRNMMEAPIQWLIQLGTFFQAAMQSVSSYSANVLGKAKADQSGKAIEALQMEASQGNYSYPDGVNRGVGVMYQQWLSIIPKLYNKAQAQTIIKADGEHEQVLINQLFDHPSGKKNADGTPVQISHDLAIGRYSVRVQAGPSFQTRNDAALENLANMFKASPQLLLIPGVAASYCKILGEGNPKVDMVAAMLPGGAGDDSTPQELQAKVQQLTAQLQQLQQQNQQLTQTIQAKIPQAEASKFNAYLNYLKTIQAAQITASKDADSQKADRDAAQVETLLGFAHDAATQAQEHANALQLQGSDQAHEAALAAAGAQTDSDQSAQEHGQALEQQAAAPGPTGQ